MNNIGKVAIVMPVYNAEKFIKKTVQNILDQKYPYWELFVIDDGSTDGSIDILKKFTDPRIKVYSGVINEKENNGPSKTRNIALDAIKNSKDYSFVAYCDSDDRWRYDHLLVALNPLLASPKIDMVYTDCSFEKEDGTSAITYGVPYYEKFDRLNLLKQNFIYISSVVHRVGCLSVGGFDENCVPMEDYDMWLRITNHYVCEHVIMPTVTYMFKDGGSYYNTEQSIKAHAFVHLKNNIIADDLPTLELQLVEIQKMKNIMIRTQKYEDAARLRDTEKTIIRKINEIKGPQEIEGWLSVVEGEALAMYGDGKDCLEIGSYKGKSANYIAPKAKSLVCIDPFRADESGQNQFVDYTTLKEFLKNTDKFKNITPVIGKSQDVFNQFKDEQFDMIFVDGMHDHDSVMEDIKKYWPKLKIGGVMCFHDYQKDWIGVISAVDSCFGNPDELYDSIAVVKKTSESIPMIGGESKTITEILGNKFLLMKYMHMTSEEIDKLNFYEFDTSVKLIKERLTEEDALKDAGAIVIPSDKDRVIKKVVVICPFSRNLPTGEENPKNFPYWEELVQQMKDFGCYVIQIGVSGEKFIGADEVIFNASNERLLEVLNGCDTFVSIDSFFPHFAHYHGKHGIVIFSQSDPNLFGYPENLNILKSRDYLRKEQFWLWTQTKFNKDAFISSKVVLDNVLEILQLK